jgi:hypothetical protein
MSLHECIVCYVFLFRFSYFVISGDITQQFLFCKPLQEITKGQDILDVVDSYFSSCDLSWKSCISICTDGAPSVLGSMKEFVALSKQKNPAIVFTHFPAQRGAHFEISST